MTSGKSLSFSGFQFSVKWRVRLQRPCSPAVFCLATECPSFWKTNLVCIIRSAPLLSQLEAALQLEQCISHLFYPPLGFPQNTAQTLTGGPYLVHQEFLCLLLPGASTSRMCVIFDFFASWHVSQQVFSLQYMYVQLDECSQSQLACVTSSVIRK